MSPDSPVQPTRETGFHQCFARHTRNFVEYNGFWLAQGMTGHRAIDEYWARRERAVVMDLSPLRKFEVLGPDAEALLQYCLTSDMRKLSVGQCAYTAVCHEHGGMMDDGIVYRLSDSNFRWVGSADASGLHLREVAQEKGLNVHVRSATDHLCNIAVQGPNSRELLREIIWTPPTQPSVDELGGFRFAIARIGNYDGAPLVLSRTGYTGELGFEIFCAPKDAETVFDAVWEAGQPHGLIPLRLAALERRKANPVRKLVGLDIEGGIVPASGDCIRRGRAQVGEITSAMRSPILGKVIALAPVDVTHAEIATELEVGQLDGLQKRLAAKVVRSPHFDPTKERVKGNYD